MKIGLPDNPNNKKKNNNKKKTHNKKKGNDKKGFKNKKKGESNEDKGKKKISWRERDGFITAIISKKLIKINLSTFTIYLPNGFNMKAKNLKEAKKKAIEFLS